MLLGRVFVDTNQNGQFDDGDRPSPGVRLYLNNGQSVITDSEGLYNFPALNDGSIVISLDPVSLPSHYALSDGGRYSGKSWTRLLRTPIGGGGLLRQNFALIETAVTCAVLRRHPPPLRSEAAATVPVPGSGQRRDQILNRSKRRSRNQPPPAPTSSLRPKPRGCCRGYGPRRFSEAE